MIITDQNFNVPKNTPIGEKLIFIIPINKYKKSIIKKACEYGFNTPIFTDKIYDDKQIYMTLHNTYDNNYGNKVSIKISEENIKQCSIAYSIFINDKKNCESYIYLSPETIRILKNYRESLYFKTGKDLEQREISGRIVLVPIKYLKNGVTNVIAHIDEKSIIKGDKQESDLIIGNGTFHTHPEEAYIENQVKYGWPSKDDYRTFLHIFVEFYGIFHIVSCREGIYIITIKEGIERKDLERIYKNFIEDGYKEYEYDCNKIKINPNDYVRQINNKGLFNIKLIEWKDIEKPIRISWDKINGNCLFSDNQIKINREIEIK